jgi:prephenate dehydratase
LNRLVGVQFAPETDTGGAVARIKRRGLMDAGAIASERAAEIYGMKVLARGIEDPPANITRFLLLAPEPIEPKRRAKTTLVFAVKDLTRQFFSCISLFALRELPLSKIESRPVKGRHGQFLFYVDVTRSLSDPDLEQAVAQLREIAPWVRVLGCYPQGKRM